MRFIELVMAVWHRIRLVIVGLNERGFGSESHHMRKAGPPDVVGARLTRPIFRVLRGPLDARLNGSSRSTNWAALSRESAQEIVPSQLRSISPAATVKSVRSRAGCCTPPAPHWSNTVRALKVAGTAILRYLRPSWLAAREQSRFGRTTTIRGMHEYGPLRRLRSAISEDGYSPSCRIARKSAASRGARPADVSAKP
jgi:hypothetical protein